MAKDIIWTDRKRIIFGLPWTFTKYILTKEKLLVETGILNKDQEEIRLYRIMDMTLRRSLWQRLFGVGTVTVMSSDKTMPTLVLKNIKDPIFVKELIHKQVEETKIKRRVRFGEIMTDADGDGDPDDDMLDDEM